MWPRNTERAVILDCRLSSLLTTPQKTPHTPTLTSNSTWAPSSALGVVGAAVVIACYCGGYYRYDALLILVKREHWVQPVQGAGAGAGGLLGFWASLLRRSRRMIMMILGVFHFFIGGGVRSCAFDICCEIEIVHIPYIPSTIFHSYYLFCDPFNSVLFFSSGTLVIF